MEVAKIYKTLEKLFNDKSNNLRYVIVNYGVLHACCYNYTIIDTTIAPDISSELDYNDSVICEVLKLEDAIQICHALNN